MKIIHFDDLEFIPASHEDQNNPGVLKKVLLKKDELLKGQIQMINWAKLLAGKSFAKHYHEDMEEIFIILNGRAKIIIDDEEEILEKGDGVVIPLQKIHEMINISSEDVNYIALGISSKKGGKTIIV